MEPAALTLLVEILDAGNLSQAARKLKMTRANVSYHLTQLERSVGLQLVHHTPGGADRGRFAPVPARPQHPQ
jgi:molybdate transport repressor ModE-like protein